MPSVLLTAMLSNITIDESRHSASVHSIFGALSTSSSFEVKPAPEPNHDSESPGLSKLMVSPTRSLRGLSIAGGHSSSSSLVSTRKETSERSRLDASSSWAHSEILRSYSNQGSS